MCRIPCSFDTSAMARESAEFVLPKRKSILSPPINLRAFITAVPGPTARVLNDEFNRTAKDAALRVDGVNRHLTADELVFPQRREGKISVKPLLSPLLGQWLFFLDAQGAIPI